MAPSTFTMHVDYRPDGKVVPFLRQTYYTGGVVHERDIDALTGESYQVHGAVLDYDPSGTVAERLREFAAFCAAAAEAPRKKPRWWRRSPHPPNEIDMTMAAAENLGLR